MHDLLRRTGGRCACGMDLLPTIETPTVHSLLPGLHSCTVHPKILSCGEREKAIQQSISMSALSWFLQVAKGIEWLLIFSLDRSAFEARNDSSWSNTKSE